MTRENQEILKRINMRKPEYSVAQWAKDWDENQKFMDNISAYPVDWWMQEVLVNLLMMMLKMMRMVVVVVVAEVMVVMVVAAVVLVVMVIVE